MGNLLNGADPRVRGLATTRLREVYSDLLDFRDGWATLPVAAGGVATRPPGPPATPLGRVNREGGQAAGPPPVTEGVGAATTPATEPLPSPPGSAAKPASEEEQEKKVKEKKKHKRSKSKGSRRRRRSKKERTGSQEAKAKTKGREATPDRKKEKERGRGRKDSPEENKERKAPRRGSESKTPKKEGRATPEVRETGQESGEEELPGEEDRSSDRLPTVTPVREERTPGPLSLPEEKGRPRLEEADMWEVVPLLPSLLSLPVLGRENHWGLPQVSSTISRGLLSGRDKDHPRVFERTSATRTSGYRAGTFRGRRSVSTVVDATSEETSCGKG